MSWSRRICWSAVLWACLGAACTSEPEAPGPSAWQPSGNPDCHAELSEAEVGLMAPVDLTVRALTDSRQDLPFAGQIPAGFVGDVESRVVQQGEGWLHTVLFHLRPTGLGEIKVPPFKIEQGGETVTTSELVLKVASTLGASDDRQAVEGQAALEPLPAWWPVVLGALAVLVLVAGWLWWLRRPRSAPVMPVEVPVPAHVKALRALSQLTEPVTESEIEPFYVDVSQILRVYLEERFGLHAPTRSTEEFLVELEAGESLGLEHRQSLSNFLRQCDLVKFARLHPGIEVHEQTLRIASTVVGETRADLAPGGAA